ncbi:MAG: lipoyl(octanoyl) transferase LipB [Gemmatimonadales bacterium]
MSAGEFEVRDLGRLGYTQALALQRALRLERIAGVLDHDVLLLVEHDPVYTLGRGTHADSLPVHPDALRRRGAEVVDVERGGDVTWHGPGQLVGYPIIHLSRHREDLHWYLRTLEAVLISALDALGITATTSPGNTGVWVDDRKIASIGIHVKQWVTLHGFALNVSPDLTWFGHIVPCGLQGVVMTSVATERGVTDTDTLWATAMNAVVAAFADAFELDQGISAKPLR